MRTLFVKRLTVIDCAYLSRSRGLVGESWQVDIELDGELDHQGMVLDFAEIKRTIKRLIDARFDHKLIIPAEYEGLRLSEHPGGCHVSFACDDGPDIEHRSPHDAIRCVPATHICANGLARIIGDDLLPHTPDNVHAIRVRLWPEAIDGAFYHYTHGLKRHDGNCQRIAHGHRSRLEILRDGQRASELEQDWAARWRDIYIASREDLVGISQRDGRPCYEFAYRSAHGDFGLTLAQHACYLIDDDSTVENIAQHIAATLKREQPEHRFTVYAYEGVDKGAVGEA